MKKLGWLAAGLVLGGCFPPRVTRSGHPLTPRGEGCAFEVITLSADGYSEIGTLDIAPGVDGVVPFTIPDLRKAVAKDVCEMGGDAILPTKSTQGAYISATVLHRVAGAPATPAASAAAPVAAPAAALGDGCHYDTQCKGDRICSGGQCVNPPAK